MKRIAMCTMVLTVALLAMASLATAGVPLEWNYQGHLTDDLGAPLDITVSMTFVIYDDSVGGTALWTEMHPSVVVTGGGFSVRLGSITPIPDGALDFPTENPQAWLGVTVGSDAEMTPRTVLLSVPYTYRVSTIDGASGGVICGDVSIHNDLVVTNLSDAGFLETFFTYMQADTSGASLVLGYDTVFGNSLVVPYEKAVDIYSNADGSGFALFNPDTSGVSIVVDSSGSSLILANPSHGERISLMADDTATWFIMQPTYEPGIPQAGGLIARTIADNSEVCLLSTEATGVPRKAKMYADTGRVGIMLEYGGPDPNDTAGIQMITDVVGPRIAMWEWDVESRDSSVIRADGLDFFDGGGNPIIHVGVDNIGSSMTFGKIGDTYRVSVMADDTASMITMYGNDGSLFRAHVTEYSGLTLIGPGRADSVSITNQGITFPDGSIQITAGGGGSCCWECPVNYTYLTDIDDSVGIGTETPSEKLQVTGNIYVTGKGRIGSAHDNSGSYAFVAGFGHTALGAYSSVSGGYGNSANALYSHVSGGGHNEASGNYSNVSGGDGNAATGDWANVGGGQFDTASGDYATISGGVSNIASGPQTAVGGGGHNTATGDQAVVAGGWDNDATGWRSAVSGGVWNTASGSWSSVGGGASNLAGNNDATVSGGAYNTASGWGSTISGGDENSASGTQSVIAGGARDTAWGELSAISGGAYNVALSYACAIPGGKYNRIDTAADYSLAFGWGVCINDSFQTIFYNSDSSGRVGINRDGCADGIDYPLHIGTDGSNGNGAHLTEGGSWTSKSARDSKDNFEPLDGKQLLEKVSSMQLEAWNYKGTDERHIGPVAEDFAAAFDVGTIREDDGMRENHYLAASDVAGVALIGVQELTKENAELRQRIEQLESMVQALLAQTNGGSDKLASNK